MFIDFSKYLFKYLKEIKINKFGEYEKCCKILYFNLFNFSIVLIKKDWSASINQYWMFDF